MSNLKLITRLCCSSRNLFWKLSLICICITAFKFLVSHWANTDPVQVYGSSTMRTNFIHKRENNNNNARNGYAIKPEKELDWQEIKEIGGSDDVILETKFFVYSAYMDFYENENILRVVAVTPSHSGEILYCHVFDKQMYLLATVSAELRTTRCPQNTLAYSAAYILCKLDTYFNASNINPWEFFNRMKFVSVSPSKSVGEITNVSNILNIIVPPNGLKEPHRFGLCVQPTYNYDNVFEFVQWMEIHKMMGVSHFTFYDMSIGPKVTCVMKSKAVNQETPMQILQWTVPIVNHSLLHVNAQISQSHDCAFRYRGVSKYLVSVDFDEVILPNYVYARNYEELIQVIDSTWKATTNESRPIVAQYQFRGGFFGSEFGEFPKNTNNRTGPKKEKDIRKRNQVELEDLTIYKFVIRQETLLPYKQRSKFITIPRRVIEPGVHELDEAVGGGIEIMVPYEAGFLHHYRLYYGCGNNCSSIPHAYDFTGHFFVLSLLEKVQIMMDKLGEECDIRDAMHK